MSQFVRVSFVLRVDSDTPLDLLRALVADGADRFEAAVAPAATVLRKSSRKKVAA